VGLSKEAIVRMIENALRPIVQRVLMIVARGVLEAIKDGQGIQLAKATFLKGETREDLERVQNYGMTSNPPDGSEVVGLFVGGNREHGFIIGCDNRTFRLKALAKGEVALYTDEGDKIHFKRGGLIQIFSDNVEIGKTALEKILNGETFQTRYNAHTQIGNLGVPTGVPIIPSPPGDLSGVVKGAT